MLTLLSQYNAKVTFFIIGKNAIKNKYILERISALGHSICNHTFSHPLLCSHNNKFVIRQVLKCEKILNSYYGFVRLFRPPEGMLSFKGLYCLRRCNYRVLWWAIDSKDFMGKASEDIIYDLKKCVSDDCVILFHDNDSKCVEVLTSLLPYWINKGYSFKKLT